MYDVIAVNIETHKVRLIAERESKKFADAIERMVMMRRGVDEEFFNVVPSGKYREGDIYGTKD